MLEHRRNFNLAGGTVGSWKPLSPSQYHALDLAVAFGITDVGTVRRSNQDNFLIVPDLGLVAVADGMGGHDGGEIASAGALELLGSHLAGLPGRPSHDPDATWGGVPGGPLNALRGAIGFANDQLHAANVAAGHAEGTGMGTTLTGLWRPAPHGPAYVFHVGDSRLYCWRGGTLHQLTRDQTLYQQALDLGAPAPLPPRNLLLQALGPSADIHPDVSTWDPAPGDVCLLCSDGLHGESSARDIAAILAGARHDNLDDCCAALVGMAKRDGSRDNITAVLLYCRG
jgi:protein phosphatase